MQRSTVEGQLNVERSGSGSETLLLIHGFADNLATWHKVVPHLETRYRVLAVDLPGFGRSSAAWPRPLIAGYVALLADLIESEGSRRVTVIGNSLGAATALALGTAHPHLVDRLVLCDMPGIDTLPRTWKLLGTKPTEMLLRTLATPIPAPILQQAIGIAYAYGAMRHPLQSGFSTVRSSFDMHYADKSRVLGLLPLARQVFVELAEMPIRRMVRELEVPVMLLWGQWDLLTPSRKARSFVGGPTRRVVVIPDCGHCPQLDRPAEFLDAVVPFLTAKSQLAS